MKLRELFSPHRPAGPRIVLRPALATLGLHGLLIVAITANWSFFEPEVVRHKPVPKVIAATLVDPADLAQPEPKPTPEPKPAPKPEPKPAPKPEPKSEPAPKPEPKPAPKPEPKPAPKPEPKPAPKPEPKPEPQAERKPGPTPQELAELTRQAQARQRAEAAQRSAAQQAAAEGERLAASYAALIQQTVIRYWSRPPSARNNMEAVLSIQLIPTGDVVSVSVLRSSGDSAFDRSAIAAVERAGSFPELKNLPPREFERNFRRFRLVFRPEDLRY